MGHDLRHNRITMPTHARGLSSDVLNAALAGLEAQKQAIEHHQQGINLIKDLAPSLALVRLYEEAAWLYMQVGDNMLAIYASEKALRLAETLGEARAASRAHGIFGRVFGRIGDTVKLSASAKNSDGSAVPDSDITWEIHIDPWWNTPSVTLRGGNPSYTLPEVTNEVDRSKSKDRILLGIFTVKVRGKNGTEAVEPFGLADIDAVFRHVKSRAFAAETHRVFAGVPAGDGGDAAAPGADRLPGVKLGSAHAEKRHETITEEFVNHSAMLLLDEAPRREKQRARAGA